MECIEREEQNMQRPRLIKELVECIYIIDLMKAPIQLTAFIVFIWLIASNMGLPGFLWINWIEVNLLFFLVPKCQILAGSSFLKVKPGCFCLSAIKRNIIFETSSFFH